jgi:phenylacetate-CoA ligase
MPYPNMIIPKKINRAAALFRKLRSTRYSRRAIEANQSTRLGLLVRHAYETVPYYHDLFSRHGVKPEDIQTVRDLWKIPVSTKQDLLAAGLDRITSEAVNVRRLKRISTSGSSGEPFAFYMASAKGSYPEVNAIRTYMLHGLIPTDRVLKIGGSETIIDTPSDWIGRLFFRRVALSSFCDYREIYDFYHTYKPKVIRGFISSLYAFSLWLETEGLRMNHRPRFIACSAEMVHGYMRAKVEKVFKTRIVDIYATAELGFVASQCLHGGYHVFEDSVIVEFSPSGDRSLLIGTNLDNVATPFIRYNTGDVCEPAAKADTVDRCRCGQTTRKIDVLSGRDNDFILTPGGRRIAPIDMIFYMRNHYASIDQFRFIQKATRTIRVEIVAESSRAAWAAGRLADGIRKFTGGLDPEVHLVDRIPLDKSGKLRIIRSAIET